MEKDFPEESRGEDEKDSSLKIIGGFGIPFAVMDRTMTQKFNKKKREQYHRPIGSNTHVQNTPLNKIRIHRFLKCTWNIVQDGV